MKLFTRLKNLFKKPEIKPNNKCLFHQATKVKDFDKRITYYTYVCSCKKERTGYYEWV